uniref:Coenzyme B12 dependent isobutyl CoA mutase-like protein n=1 Tax=Streptomyces coelicolor TaxID=1902 RepID=O87450_STRCH|nr:coenzyme B12 dependent isobutyl CoA mutase-like protein [Streptomyces coelicolor]
MKRVSRSPTSSRGASPIASGARRAGAKATSMAASKTCSLVPK